MGEQIKWSEWIDNTGEVPEIPDGKRIQTERLDGRVFSTFDVDLHEWKIGGYGWNIKRYRVELPDTTPETPEEEWGPWIGWNGGECPVDEGQIVQVVRLGVEEPETVPAGLRFWEHGKMRMLPDVDVNYPIVAYRVLKEPEVKTSDITFYLQPDASHLKQLVGDDFGLIPDLYRVDITLTETNGQREWSISEVQSDG